MKNIELRQEAKAAGVKLWQIAEQLKMNDGNFSRLLRRELSSDQKKKIKKIISELRG